MNRPLNHLLEDARHSLAAAGVETSAYELRLLLAAAVGADPGRLLFEERPLTPAQQKTFAAMLQKRAQHMPVDKILGRRGFYKYDFQVTTDVLSPRPDTEVLVEAALDSIRREGAGTVLELGVGSGCIIATLLAEVPQLRGIGIDISAAALEVAAANAAALGVEERLQLRQGSWFAPDFSNFVGTAVDVLVSNPPYIPTAEISGLDAEVRDYDPALALDGGSDGMDSYRRIAELAMSLLKPGGRIFLEVGEGQAEAVMQIFSAQGLLPQKTISDLSAIERCVCLKK